MAFQKNTPPMATDSRQAGLQQSANRLQHFIQFNNILYNFYSVFYAICLQFYNKILNFLVFSMQIV